MSKDLFSNQSEVYSRHRPGYPRELIDYILQFVSERNAAWDCATGNGQAALLLASHFESVQATDISERQLSNAIQHPHIRYSISGAEKTPFPDNSFDLITVAQAYHWFDFSAFENEAKRLLKPSGILAVWGYSLLVSFDININKTLRRFYKETVGRYWDPERKYIDDHYQSVPFPYHELPPAEFSIKQQWSLEDLSGYLNTWSSVQHFITANGFNPVEELTADLKRIWPLDNIILFSFPLFLRLGRTQ